MEVKLSDSEIINQVIKGDKDQYRHLINRYKDQVYSMIMRLVRDKDVSEDLAQEVFIKAYKGLKGFKYQSKFSTWLISIAVKHTHSYFRSKKYKQNQKSEELLGTEKAHNNPEKKYEEKEKIELFKNAIVQLKPKLREVLIMCGIEQKPYEDVATVLEIPVGTVRSRLNAARKELKNMLGGTYE